MNIEYSDYRYINIAIMEFHNFILNAFVVFLRDMIERIGA